MLKKLNFDIEKKGLNLKTKIFIVIFIFLSFIYLLDKFFDAYTLTSPINIKIQIKSPIEKRTPPSLKNNRSQGVKKTSSKDGGLNLSKNYKKNVKKIESYPKLLNEKEYQLRLTILDYLKNKLSENELIAMDNIFKRESGYNPEAKNEIGAGGLCQAYPYTKMNCQLSFYDWKCQVDWCLKYIINRYKNPIEAWKFHLVNNWF